MQKAISSAETQPEGKETPYKDIQAEVNVTGMCSTADCRFCVKEFSPIFHEAPPGPFLAKTEPSIRAFVQGGGTKLVITGGEPTEAPQKLLGTIRIINKLRTEYPHVRPPILYTNGTGFGRRINFEGKQGTILEHLRSVGLTDISLSVHHHEPERRASVSKNQMGALNVEQVIRTGQDAGLNVRLNCTLIREHIGDMASIKTYIDWAHKQGIRDIYFRDLFKVEHRGALTTPGRAEVLSYTDDNRIDFDKLLQDLRADSDFAEVGQGTRHSGTGSSVSFTHLPTGMMTTFGSLTIAPKEIDEEKCCIYVIDQNGDTRTDYYDSNLNPEEQKARSAKIVAAKEARGRHLGAESNE